MNFKNFSNKSKILIYIASITTLGIFLYANFESKNKIFEKAKSLINDVKKNQTIRKYIFPYRLISNQKILLDDQSLFLQTIRPIIYTLDLFVKESGDDIDLTESYVQLKNQNILRKYKLNSGFYSGIQRFYPGSGYIDFYEKNFFVLSSRGLLAFKRNLNDKDEKFKQIKNNINDFIGSEQFKKSNKFSIKDLLIFKEKIFISYTEEIKENCWSTSLLFGDINFENIKFEKLFSSKECVNSIKNLDNEFQANQSGGRIAPFNNQFILLSTGDYRSRFLAQNEKSIFGKLIKINLKNSEYKIISMGHRNPQGLYVDYKNKLILETEHGPKGGDEINLIQISKINKNIVQNYGWPVVSDGEHYGDRNKNEEKYRKYPLYKSHKKYGFISPLKSFVPSIGISEVTKIGENKFVVSSLKDRSLYFFELNSNRELINLNKLKVFERIRDLKFKDNNLYMFLEDTASIGIISLNDDLMNFE